MYVHQILMSSPISDFWENIVIMNSCLDIATHQFPTKMHISNKEKFPFTCTCFPGYRLVFVELKVFFVSSSVLKTSHLCQSSVKCNVKDHLTVG